MLIGIDKLLDLCNLFIEDNCNTDFENVELSTDFFCYPDTNEVFVSIVALVDSFDEFMENLQTRTDITDISVFTWSFLHEVGHCMTWNYLNKRTKHHCEHVKRKIDRGSIPTKIYYTLADEKMATDWALRFVTDNYKIVKTFDEKTLDILNKIYLDNKIDLEG